MSRKPARKAIRRGTIMMPLVLICLVGSAALRLAAGAGTALAAEVEKILPAKADGHGDSSGSHDAPQGELAMATCPDDDQLNAMLSRLAEREAQVAEAEKRVDARDGTLKATEERIAARLTELKAAEESLASTMQRTSTASEGDLSTLTAVYDTMKPKEAIPLFEAMEPDFAAGFLARMRPEAAGAILAGMSPDRAYAVSAILAGRNAKVPKRDAHPPAAQH